jgi:hypothetical protein
MRRSLEGSIGALLSDPIGRELLAEMDTGAVAARIVAEDLYGDGVRMRQAASIAGADVLDWCEHRLWCAQREALGRRAEPLRVSLTGRDHRHETVGWATVVVAPMTLAMADALSVIGVVADGREVIVFGHDVFSDDVTDPHIDVADPTRKRTRSEIENVLDRGGIYCTYGDFTYAGLPARRVHLFGRPRPMSAGWIELAARDHTMLQPVLCRRLGNAHVVVELAEPVRIDSRDGRAQPEAVGALLAELLEAAIRTAPSQWLLLPTLSFDSPEMATA